MFFPSYRSWPFLSIFLALRPLLRLSRNPRSIPSRPRLHPFRFSLSLSRTRLLTLLSARICGLYLLFAFPILRYNLIFLCNHSPVFALSPPAPPPPLPPVPCATSWLSESLSLALCFPLSFSVRWTSGASILVLGTPYFVRRILREQLLRTRYHFSTAFRTVLYIGLDYLPNSHGTLERKQLSILDPRSWRSNTEH